MKQGARIIEVITAEEGREEEGAAEWNQPVRFIATSNPALAESRECYRISTVIVNLNVDVANENCKLLDVSIRGLAVKSNEGHKIGSTVPATPTHEGGKFSGTACVQSVCKPPDGSYHFGLLCSDQRSRDSELKVGLQKMSMSLQREQLRRMLGAA